MLKMILNVSNGYMFIHVSTKNKTPGRVFYKLISVFTSGVRRKGLD